jgi:chromosome segregation ATPase
VAAAVALTPSGPPTPTPSPPPTRIGPLAAESFKPPSVHPVPEVPEGGLIPAARYALQFMRARWQRRGVIKQLGAEIRAETTELDSVLGTLGRQARDLRIENRVYAAENAAIDAAEQRRTGFEQELAELTARVGEENARFHEIETERGGKVSEAEGAFGAAQRELAGLEAQRRSLREKRKMVERTQKGYLQAADQRDEQAGRSAMGDARAGLRRAAEELRRDAAGMDPERQDLDRRLSALERPISQAAAQVEALRAELDSARRSLNDAREGHRHRLAEIEAEQARKSRERTLADAEIQRRLVTLGTLVNLHRVDQPEFADLYDRVDQLRAAIGARSAEIDRLTAEREAYDKRSLMRGFLTLGGAVVLLITLIVILLAIF